MKKLSIIIPAYNIGKYLSKTIDSILKQVNINYEMIIVDDGSTDNTRLICNDYERNPKIKIVYQKNCGVSAARNKGMLLANGDYILFVDGDDWLEPNSLEIILNKIEKNDMLIFGFYEKYMKRDYKKIVSDKDNIINNSLAIKNVINNKYGGYIFNKVFKRDIIVKNKLKFRENIHMCEDMIFVLEYLQCSSRIKVINNILYNYRMRKSSAVWQKNEKYLTIFDSYQIMNDILKNESIANDYINFKILNSYLLLNKNQKSYIEKKYKYNKKTLFKIVKLSKLISDKDKKKLFLLKNFRIIYYVYMHIKLIIYKRYA